MKKKSLIFPILVGILLLASCVKQKPKVSPTKDTKESTSETTTNPAGITAGGEYYDGGNWGELHS